MNRHDVRNKIQRERIAGLRDDEATTAEIVGERAGVHGKFIRGETAHAAAGGERPRIIGLIVPTRERGRDGLDNKWRTARGGHGERARGVNKIIVHAGRIGGVTNVGNVFSTGRERDRAGDA